MKHILPRVENVADLKTSLTQTHDNTQIKIRLIQTWQHTSLACCRSH